MGCHHNASAIGTASKGQGRARDISGNGQPGTIWDWTSATRSVPGTTKGRARNDSTTIWTRFDAENLQLPGLASSGCARGCVEGWPLTRRVIEDSVPDIPDGLVQFVHGVTDLAVRGVIAH